MGARTAAAPKGTLLPRSRAILAEAVPLVAAIAVVPSVAFLGLYQGLLEVSVAMAVLCGLIGLALTMTCLLAFMVSGIGWWLAGERWVAAIVFLVRGAITLMAYEFAWRAELYGEPEGAFGVLLAIAAAIAIVSPALLAFVKRDRSHPEHA